MNEVTYVATEMQRSPNLDYAFGRTAIVLVNGIQRFSLNAVDKWNHLVLVIVLSGNDAAAVHISPSRIASDLDVLAQLFPPF